MAWVEVALEIDKGGLGNSFDCQSGVKNYQNILFQDQLDRSFSYKDMAMFILFQLQISIIIVSQKREWKKKLFAQRNSKQLVKGMGLVPVWFGIIALGMNEVV